jgi:hypothetical protein
MSDTDNPLDRMREKLAEARNILPRKTHTDWAVETLAEAIEALAEAHEQHTRNVSHF